MKTFTGQTIRGLFLIACCPVFATCRTSPRKEGFSTSYSHKREKSPAPASWSAQPSKTRFLRQSGFNLPWISYGHDVGWPPKTGTPQQMGFGFFQPLIQRRAVMEEKMGALRVWAFADNRSGFLGPQVQPGFTARCIRDMSAFMDSVPAHITIIWVLYDYMIADGLGSEWGGRAGEARNSLASPAGWKEAWNRVEPCLSLIQERYGHRIIWDIINEPLNGVRMVVDDADWTNIKGFVWTHMKELLAMEGRVSLGVRNMGTLLNFWAPVMHKAQREIQSKDLPSNHLVVQFHHYPGHELSRENALKGFNAEALRRELNLPGDTPILLGECLPDAGYTLSDYYEKGFSGVLFWQDALIRTNHKEVRRQIQELAGGRKRKRSDFPVTVVTVETKPRLKKAPISLEHEKTALDLTTCRSVTNGPPYDREWLEKMGGGSLAFNEPVMGENHVLHIPMEVNARKWGPDEPFWTQKKRKGEILCSLSAANHPVNLQNTVIEVVITPPVEAVAHPWGSGSQIVLQDDSGRRLHGHWTGLSKISGGKKQVLRFRPPETAVPGMGARHKGFRLDRVLYAGFLWAASTFATANFKSEMKLHRITIVPCRGAGSSRNFQSRQTVFCTGDYPTYHAESINITRPETIMDLSSCRFIRSNYPYFSSISRVSSEDSLPWRPRPEVGGQTVVRKNPSFNNQVMVHMSLDHENPFGMAGAISTDVSTDCPGFKGAALNLQGGTLRLKTGTTGKEKESVKIQLTLRDLAGTVCYTRSTAHPGETLTVSLTDGPEMCSAGKGVDFKKIQNIGLVFTLVPEWSAPLDEILHIDNLTIEPAAKP